MKLSDYIKAQSLDMGAAGLLRWSYFKAKRLGERLYLGDGLGEARTFCGTSRILYRRRSSDLYVYFQIFLASEYAPILKTMTPMTVLDCGANAGYSSAFFLLCCPGSRVVAIEPDPENVALARRNLAPFGDRAVIHQGAVWSGPAKLHLEQPTMPLGTEWAQRVTNLASGGGPIIEALDVVSWMDRSGWSHVDLLKMDIEGAEGEVFSSSNLMWLDRVRAIAIELHGGENEKIFHRAIAGRGFTCVRSGELTLAWRA